MERALRGTIRSRRIHKEVCKSWKWLGEETAVVGYKGVFLSDFITPRAYAYGNAVVSRMKLKLHSQTLPEVESPRSHHCCSL